MAIAGEKMAPHMAEGEKAVRWTPLLGVLALIGFALVSVMAVRFGAGPVPAVGADPFRTAGQVLAVTDIDGTVRILDPSGSTEIAVYPAGPGQFASGALRSLSRMAREAYGPGEIAADVIVMRSGLVFLRDPRNGEKVSLDAFNREKAKDLARRVTAVNGGTRP